MGFQLRKAAACAADDETRAQQATLNRQMRLHDFEKQMEHRRRVLEKKKIADVDAANWLQKNAERHYTVAECQSENSKVSYFDGMLSDLCCESSVAPTTCTEIERERS